MKIKLNELVNSLGKVITTTKDDKNMPILKGTLFSVENNILVLQSTDLINSSIVNMPCEEIKMDQFCIEGRLFYDVLKKLKGEYINIDIVENKLEYEANNFKGDFDLLNASDFPIISIMQGNQIKLKSNDFRKLVKYTTFATKQDESKPVLSCCNIEIVNGIMCITALDGFRVAHLGISVEVISQNENEPININVMASFLTSLEKKLDTNEEIKIVINEKDIAINIGSDIYISKLVKGEYINFKKIIPSKFKTTIAVNRESLLNSIETLFTLKSQGILEIKLALEDGFLEISAQNERGKLKTTLEVGQNGEDIITYFNAAYILDVLKALSCEDIYLQIADLTPGTIILPNDKEEKYIYFVLPVLKN